MPIIYVLIPIYNEEENIARLIESLTLLQNALKKWGELFLLFVDDGSQDQSSKTIESICKIDHFIIKHEKNYGPGRAFANGYAWLAERLNNDDWVLSIEGDNTSRSTLIKQMFIRSEEGYDVILASPYMYGGAIINTSAFKRFLSFMSNLFLKEMLELRGIFTMSSFFRLHKAQQILILQQWYSSSIIESKGFEGIVEMLIKMVLLKFKISEVPLVLDTKMRAGKSKMKIVKTIIQLLSLIFKKRKWKRLLTRKENF